MRVVIIAESIRAAESIRHGLRHTPSCQVLGFADVHAACHATLTRTRPDVVVVDDARDASTLLERIREARGAAPDAKIVLLATDMDGDRLAEAAAAGIDAAIAKSAHPASVGTLVREVVAGHVFHAFAAGAREAAAQATPDELTTRELEVLKLVAGGLPNSGIAARLWVTEQTVKFHLSNIYRKLDLRNRTEASHYAHVHGLVAPHAAGPRSDVALAA